MFGDIVCKRLPGARTLRLVVVKESDVPILYQHRLHNPSSLEQYISDDGVDKYLAGLVLYHSICFLRPCCS